jgi:hypothetical protein
MKRPESRTALVVGGTGMLSAASEHLAAKFDEVAVLARQAKAFSMRSLKFRPYSADWSALAAFLAALDDAVDRHGPFDTALVWCHDEPEGLPLQIAERLARAGGVRRYFHVLGSASAAPDRETDVARLQEKFDSVLHGAWRRIVLGFVVENGSSRWLRNSEIAAGTIRAIDSDTGTTIGTIRPWSLRP